MSPTAAQNVRGEWVPAIPLPFYLRRRVQCSCGRKFKKEEDYRGHYAYAHILGMVDDSVPGGKRYGTPRSNGAP